MRDAVAIIPARGGSKRLPRKNLLPFRGKPMLAHTVEAAVGSGVFRKVLFTSDDPEMLRVAEDFGATSVSRPPEMATDRVGFFPAVRHALETEACHDAASLCLLMPNCPLRDAADVRASAEAFEACGSAFQLSVFDYRFFQPFWALAPSEGGLKPVFPEHFAGAHAFEQVYCPTGAIWWAKLAEYLEVRDFYGPNLAPFVLPWYRAVDIDTAGDYRMACIVAAALEHDPSLLPRKESAHGPG